jgi:hypothetical protein
VAFWPGIDTQDDEFAAVSAPVGAASVLALSTAAWGVRAGLV